jgi:hypothetical protein
MTDVNKAASLMGRKSAEAREKKWGKKAFATKMREWGKLGGRPRSGKKARKGGKSEHLQAWRVIVQVCCGRASLWNPRSRVTTRLHARWSSTDTLAKGGG